MDLTSNIRFKLILMIGYILLLLDSTVLLLDLDNLLSPLQEDFEFDRMRSWHVLVCLGYRN